MKVLAVFISPLVGSVPVAFPFILFIGINPNDFMESIKHWASTIGLIYFIALIIQIFIVETIMLSHDFLYTLKGYCCLAVFLSFCFVILVPGILEVGLVIPLLFLSLYSIGNILTYNELYFKRLEK